MSANSSQISDKSDLVIYIDKANQVSTQVPRGWRRKLLDNNTIVYIAPNEQVISSMAQLNSYLLMSGTCKCHLACPFFLVRTFHRPHISLWRPKPSFLNRNFFFQDELFNFDPRVESEEGGYDETMKVTCKHAQKSGDPLNDASKFIVQNPVNSLRTGGQPMTIQSLLNCKPPNGDENGGGQIFGYIPINISKGLNMANLISQPIIFSSPIKTTTTSTNSAQPQVLQILNPTTGFNSAMLPSTMVAAQPNQTTST